MSPCTKQYYVNKKGVIFLYIVALHTCISQVCHMHCSVQTFSTYLWSVYSVGLVTHLITFYMFKSIFIYISCKKFYMIINLGSSVWWEHFNFAKIYFSHSKIDSKIRKQTKMLMSVYCNCLLIVILFFNENLNKS